jgi:hypothetical protein
MSAILDTGTCLPPNLPGSPVPLTKYERESLAFRRLLPQLLNTDRGQYVAIHDEQVIDRERDEMALIARVLKKVGNVDIHVGLVTDQPQRAFRSGIVRDLSTPVKK